MAVRSCSPPCRPRCCHGPSSVAARPRRRARPAAAMDVIAKLPPTMTDQEKLDWAESMATVDDPFIDDMEIAIAALDLNKMD